ncbi:MAG: TraR/DksA C4-type zinc finger protein [Halioglobus sp.]
MSNEAIKQQLEERMVLMRDRLTSIKKDATQAHSGDSAEQAQERENDEVVDAIGNETAQSIRDIGAALARLEEGTYGECETCGGSIGQARLEVMPEATRCVACAE